MDIDRALETWPATIEKARNCIALRHQGMPEAVRQGIITEALKKWRPAAEQRERLVRVKEQWDTIGQRWRAALLPAGAVRRALQDVGGALLPSDIHESLSNDMTDWLHVRDMRSRYTVLDFVSEVGLA